MHSYPNQNSLSFDCSVEPGQYSLNMFLVMLLSIFRVCSDRSQHSALLVGFLFVIGLSQPNSKTATRWRLRKMVVKKIHLFTKTNFKKCSCQLGPVSCPEPKPEIWSPTFFFFFQTPWQTLRVLLLWKGFYSYTH